MDLGNCWSAVLWRQEPNGTSSTPSTSPLSGLSGSAKTASAVLAVASNVTGSKKKPWEQFLALHLFCVILMKLIWGSHNNTLQRILGLFGLDISRVYPSLSYLARPCYRCPEFSKLFQIQ